jgi:hypothetical protein
MALELQLAVCELVQDIYGGAIVAETPPWLQQPSRDNCGRRWPVAQRIYSRLAKLELPEEPPPRERRTVDLILQKRGQPPRIVEVDEKQHFNRFRAITLRAYPSSAKVAFPKRSWLEACDAKTRLEGGGFARPRPPLFPGEGRAPPPAGVSRRTRRRPPPSSWVAPNPPDRRLRGSRLDLWRPFARGDGTSARWATQLIRHRAVKEDVLEQVVDDYLKFKGYFTSHNVRFKPDPEHPEFVKDQDSVPSDVDVVGVDPQRTDLDRVIVVSCKSYQPGFDATSVLARLRGELANPKRETWRGFRELWIPKWSEAFREKIAEITGASVFSYRIAVTRLRGDPEAWVDDETITANLQGCSFGFLTLPEMWETMLNELTTTPAASEIGRLAQLLRAAGLTAATEVAEPSGPAPGSDAAIEEELEGDT